MLTDHGLTPSITLGGLWHLVADFTRVGVFMG